MTEPPPLASPDLANLPPVERDRVWVERCFQGHGSPPLRALTGGLVGVPMGVSNLGVASESLAAARYAMAINLGRL